MAIINKEDFDILENTSLKKDKYFECDELIAPIIALLNKKGYATRFCCSGHYNDEILEITYLSEITKKELAENFPGYQSSHRKKDGSTRVLLRENNSQRIYIAFEGYVDLPWIPDGCTFNSNTLDYFFDEDAEYVTMQEYEESPYNFFFIRWKKMKEIYRWAKNLPDYEDIITDEKRQERKFVKQTAPAIISDFVNQYKGQEKKQAAKYAEYLLITITCAPPQTEGMTYKDFVYIPIGDREEYLVEKLKEYKEKYND